MIDQEQDTQNTETENSEGTTSTSDQTKTSDTSTTQTETETEEKVDLGAGKTGEEDEGGNEPEDNRTDEEKAADEAAEAERAKLFGAPEGDAPYEISGLPEGMEVDKEALEAITPALKKLGLSNEGASLIAGVYAEKVLPGVAKQVVDSLNADVLAQRKTWEGEARDLIAGKSEPLKTAAGDKIDFGGRSLGEVQKLAAKALDKVAPAGFREWLDETGLGVHPQMVAFAFQIGKDIAEDRDAEPSDRGRKETVGGGRPMTDPNKFYDHS